MGNHCGACASPSRGKDLPEQKSEEIQSSNTKYFEEQNQIMITKLQSENRHKMDEIAKLEM